MQILRRNLRYKAGEVDLLARDSDGTIVLVEVKALSAPGAFDPSTKLGPMKLRKLSLLSRFVEAGFPDQNIRVDAVALYWESGKAHITHYKNITS
ncbi:hypothetical protein BH11PAT4_BH11PAT4_5520 [soil metagenome]